MMDQAKLLEELDRCDRRMVSLVDELDEHQLRVPYRPGINPPVWELGHAAFFFEYFLLRRLYGVEPLMPGFDPVWDSFDIPHRERWSPGVVPDKATTMAYYRRVIDETRGRLAAGSGLNAGERYLGQYVVAHLCMHIESQIWSRQTLGYPAPSFAGEADGVRPEDAGLAEEGIDGGDVEVPAGRWFIGMPGARPAESAEVFSFDNERPGFELDLPGFRISRTLVSNGEFRRFVEDDGYDRPELWSCGGRYWRRGRSSAHPEYWRPAASGGWEQRRFDRWQPLDPRAPVLHVSFWEAEAYCRWAGRRLPTEFEWEVAARGDSGSTLPWEGRGIDGVVPADLSARCLGTAPVGAFGEGAGPFGCRQMVGTAWEWTSSQYLPFDGFCVDMYAYMSTLQFGDHKTTRGGSGATEESLIRSTYRQAYHPDRNDVFTGFRTCAV